MLTKQALEQALPLTSVLDAHNIMLSPKQNTPFAVLCQATRDPSQVQTLNSDVTDYSVDISTMEYMANEKGPLGGSPHDFAMDELVSTIAPFVRQHISFAKNTVSPTIEAMVKRVTEQVQDVSGSVLNGMEVCVYNPPEPMFAAGMSELVERSAGATYSNVPLNFMLPEITEKDVVEMMLTMQPVLDEAILTWVAARGTAFFMNLWNECFRAKQDSNIRSINDVLTHPEYSQDYAIAMFLWARKLVVTPLDNTDIALAKYTADMSDIRDQAGSRLGLFIAKILGDEKQGVLIKSIVERRKIYVNGNVYKTWIANGGTNEILFANLLADVPNYLVADINNNIENLKGAWVRHVSMTKLAGSARRVQRTKAALVTAFNEQLKEGAGSPEESLVGGDSRARALKKFNEMLSYTTEKELDDLWEVCKRLVCRSLYAMTDAERILSDIERNKRDNPDLPVREAATLATLQYVCRWVTSQIVATSY
jgi:hypothetical protein